MLQSLHVKNLALMEETELSFGEGLNILTGETGAGKSLLIGSVNLALGAKFEREMLRRGAEQAMVELVFSGNKKTARRLEEMELESQEDGSVMISRRMQPGKSVFRINGDVVTAKQVKELAEVLIDIHGQHEHQSLLHKKKHLEILDAFAGEEAAEAAREAAEHCREYRRLCGQIAREGLDEKERAREQSLAEYECREIEEAKLREGEDEELEERYRLMCNSQKITQALSESYGYTSSCQGDGAADFLSRGLRALGSVSGYDRRLSELEQQLAELDSLLADYNRDLADYMSDVQFDEETFHQTEQRLDLLNRLKGKYGGTVEEILKYGQERQAYLDRLSDYDAYMEKLKKECEQALERLKKACKTLTQIRTRNAKVLSGLLRDALINLNFLTVVFEIRIKELPEPTENGADDVEFLISTNPGEEPRPLGEVASGGELSRIMLAIKTVLAERDEIDALIFDEIDTGISGRTAWQVSRQLGKAAAAHQVICITHLPQIAAMADHHFVIEKSSDGVSTVTDVRELLEEEALGELARLLGSDGLTEAALQNAREMRRQALESKEL